MRLVIVGSGPTALGAAFRLFELQSDREPKALATEILIIEKEASAGGLARSIRDDFGFLWDLGVHIQFKNSDPYYQNATRWAVEEWSESRRNCQDDHSDNVYQVDLSYVFGEMALHLVPYPAQFAVPFLPDEERDACMVEMLQRNGKEVTMEKPFDSFDDWVEEHFGPTMKRIFFHPYNSKIWTVNPSLLSTQWVGTRVGRPQLAMLEKWNTYQVKKTNNQDYGWGPNAVFAFPKYGGTGNIWTSLAAKLPQTWFRYNTEVIGIDARKRTLRIRDEAGSERTETYDVLLNTSPIDQLVKATGLTEPLRLERNKVVVVGIGMKKPVTPSVKPYTWLYFPDNRVPFYRVTMLSKYGEVTPDSRKYWSLLCECALAVDDESSEELIRRRTIDGLVAKGMIRRELIVSEWSRMLPYGYPIPLINVGVSQSRSPKIYFQRDGELARAHRVLEKAGIYSRGRFGGWKYEVSNQDHSFMQGKELIDRLLYNIPETTYKTGVADSKSG